jgi:hypothetical protein
VNASDAAPDDQVETSAEDRAGDRPVPLADCVLCGEPTEYPASTKGATLCPVCEWQEAQRTACSG